MDSSARGSFNDLKAAKTLHDVAKILGFEPSALSYILYKLPSSKKYTKFKIEKKKGGHREICAPSQGLRLLQSRVAAILNERDKIDYTKHSVLSHGFESGFSIITNASKHKKRRYVFNIDLENFFPSINFGRVRGVLINDTDFKLNEKVATIIAQIACHENGLPQGSPCSPVLSNIVGRILDVRLARIAKKYKCTYSRYVDDITFSTNARTFPIEIGAPSSEQNGMWQAGKVLAGEIKRAGFEVNSKKTRMQFRGSRQITTGLIVNEKVNVKSEYYKSARLMCHSLLTTGNFHFSKNEEQNSNDKPHPDHKLSLESISKLHGILQHIYYVRNDQDHRETSIKKSNPTATRALYIDFLYYKYFIVRERPLLITEGKTDSVYLRSAIKHLKKYHGALGETTKEKKFTFLIDFLKFSKTVQDVLQIGGGTGDIKHLIINYKKFLRSYNIQGMSQPIIILIDNDGGATRIFSLMKEYAEPKIEIIGLSSTKKFYKMFSNLYVVKTPEGSEKDNHSCIEDLFSPEILATKLGEKTFDKSNDNDTTTTYGKAFFAEHVVRSRGDTIDFSGFEELLDRIVAAIDDYKSARFLTS